MGRRVLKQESAIAKTLQPLASSRRSPVTLRGTGLHTGLDVGVELSWREASAPPSESLQFHLHSLSDGSTPLELSAPALYTRLSGTARSTALVLRGPQRRKAELRTIEHFMAAALLTGRMEDLEVKLTPLPTPAGLETPANEIEICELPALDGSAKLWVEALELLLAQPRPSRVRRRRFWAAVRDFELNDGAGRWVRFRPLTQSLVSVFKVGVDFGPAWRQEQNFTIDWSDVASARALFLRDIAPARTFGFTHELESLKRRGLARGGSLENALLLDEERLHNPEGFRCPNELAAHKLLDALGDVALLGAPLLGEAEFRCAGHSLHLQAVKDAVESGALVEGFWDPELNKFSV